MEGRLNQSEFIAKSVGLEERDRFLENVFPVGGHPAAQGGLEFRRKFFESYHYSDPLKAGRWVALEWNLLPVNYQGVMTLFCKYSKYFK